MIEEAFCKYPFLNIRVLSNGTVHSCCEQSTGIYGDLTTQSFDEIWFNGVAEEVREKTRNMEFHPSCSKPGGCPWLYKNPVKERFWSIGKGYPSLLDIVLPNTHCNIGGEKPSKQSPACIMCWRSDPNFWPEQDKLDEVLPKIKFLVHIPGFLHVQVSGVCEPFWKDRMFQILDKLEFDKSKSTVRLQTTTNGILLNKQRRREFLERCPLSTLRVSLDAASPETYKKLRIADAFDMIVDNIKDYASERSPEQKLEIEFNINTVNLHEVEQMMTLSSNLKPDKVIIYPTEEVHSGCASIVVNENNASEFLNAEKKVRKQSRQLGLEIDIFRPFAKHFKNLVQIKI